MKFLSSAIIAATMVVSTSGAQAASIDFTDNVYTANSHVFFFSTGYQSGPLTGFTETAEGVDFVFSAVFGNFGQVGPWGDGSFDFAEKALAIGGGGSSSTGRFTLTTSQDVTLQSFNGHAQQSAITGNLVNPEFDVLGTSSVGNTFSTEGFLGSTPSVLASFVNGPLNLLAGVTYTFDVTNRGASTLGFITSIDFETAAVPVPAALPLLLGGIGVLGFVSRKRRRSVA